MPQLSTANETEINNSVWQAVLASFTKALCLSQFQLGTSPGQPPGNCFERANLGHPGNFYCLIPCPGAKKYGRIPGGGAKFSQTRRNSYLSLPKVVKKFRKLRDSTNFCLENLTKLLYFRLKQNHWKVFKYFSLDIQLKQ